MSLAPFFTLGVNSVQWQAAYRELLAGSLYDAPLNDLRFAFVLKLR